jgi:hypothetical protein
VNLALDSHSGAALRRALQGSTAVMVTREGDCTLMHCTLGGPAERTYDHDRDIRCCASEAIQVMIPTNECTWCSLEWTLIWTMFLQVMGSAWLVVRFCVLTDTYGPGCSFLGETHSYVESCLFQVMSFIQSKDALGPSPTSSCTFSKTSFSQSRFKFFSLCEY